MSDKNKNKCLRIFYYFKFIHLSIQYSTMSNLNNSIPNKYPKFSLLGGATTVQPLTRLNELLNGVEIYVKRDDVMGMGLAGNKLRKLEYLMGDAIQKNADVIITSGGVQSNHARLTAVAASYAGIDYELVLGQAVPKDDLEYANNGNILLENILDAKLHHLPKGADTAAFIENRINTLKSEGRNPYLIPMGGSSPTGCLGYAGCFYEIIQQADDLGIHFNHIVVPNGSGGTHAGLLAASKAAGKSDIRIRSYAVLASLEDAINNTFQKATETLNLLNDKLTIHKDEVDIDPNFLGTGYGIPTKEMVDAVKLLARTEGIFLDPVYSGKAFAGLLADIKAGKFQKGERILFILTGGLPGLFAYRSAFS